MAYRFNDGKGGVTCDKCNVLIDEGLSHAEYEETYGDGPDHCFKHKPQPLKVRLRRWCVRILARVMVRRKAPDGPRDDIYPMW